MSRERCRGGLALVSGSTILGALWLALSFIAGASAPYPAGQGKGVITPAHFVYLPLISAVRACTNPPTGTVMIAGRATVHGRPAQPGVPFSLWHGYWEHWPYQVMTTTTRNDGSFCFEPIEPLSYCYGVWYFVRFDRAAVTPPDDIYTDRWVSNPIVACESGQVYTATAEIGRPGVAQ
jgi:hypothetical protein